MVSFWNLLLSFPPCFSYWGSPFSLLSTFKAKLEGAHFAPPPLPLLSRTRGKRLLQDEEIAVHSPKSPYYIPGIIYCIINERVGIQIITNVLLLNSQRSKRPDNTFRFPLATVAMRWWVSATGIKRMFGSVCQCVYLVVGVTQSLCVSLFVSEFLCDSSAMCVCVGVWVSLCESVYLSLCLSVGLCLGVSVCVCGCVIVWVRAWARWCFSLNVKGITGVQKYRRTNVITITKNLKCLFTLYYNRKNSVFSWFTIRNITSLITITSQCILTLQSTRAGQHHNNTCERQSKSLSKYIMMLNRQRKKNAFWVLILWSAKLVIALLR